MRSLLLIAIVALTISPSASSYGLISHSHPHDSRSTIHASQIANLKYVTYVCRHGAHAAKRWACKQIGWLTHEASETAPAPVLSVGYWEAKQISAANWIGAHSARDPWPNCPDPYFGGGGWDDTVRCENSGNWLDSPGYFRCGLQFDPGWERRFGRLCP